jgi:hypothetical protein
MNGNILKRRLSDSNDQLVRPATHYQVDLIRCQVYLIVCVLMLIGYQVDLTGGPFQPYLPVRSNSYCVCNCTYQANRTGGPDEVYLIVCVLLRYQVDPTGGPDQVHLAVTVSSLYQTS